MQALKIKIITTAETIILALALSADSFIVSVSNGIGLKTPKLAKFLYAPFLFGVAHIIAPLIGYWLGEYLMNFIKNYDHWVAFFILTAIGIKSILEKEENSANKKCISQKELFLQAFATSLDALAVGLTFGFLNTKVFYTVSIIGIVVFIISLSGMILGYYMKLNRFFNLNIVSGLILIAIGIKILFEHLFFY